MKSKNSIRNTLAILACLTAAQLSADVPPEQKPEVEHLINYLETSNCSMVRNGSTHKGAAATKHVRRKYKHFRNDIGSTEEFIELSATKSTMSGKPYEVHCPGKPPKESAAWLLEELEIYRGVRP